VWINISLSNDVSFSDGLIFGLLLAALAALIWTTSSDKKNVRNIFWIKKFDPLNIFTGILALATLALVVISILQWLTLDRTDQTFRAGERAFVFVTHSREGWQRAEKINDEIVREFPVVWENVGNSPTRGLLIKLYCPDVQPFAVTNPVSLPGKTEQMSATIEPKQTTWGGSCFYSNLQLKLVKNNEYHLYVIAMADYFDIFDEHHKTESCFELAEMSGNLDDLDAQPHGRLRYCERNCADKECDKP